MPDLSEVYDTSDEQQRLAAIFERRYMAILKLITAAVQRSFGIDRFRLTDSDVNRVLVEAGRRIVGIDETTRQQIVEQLRLGQELGLSNWEIANGVEKIGYRGIEGLYKQTWAGRAETIARTEIQHATNEATLNRYAATGIVDMVEIVDGDDDEPCRSRNGRVVPLSERPQLAHPNCTLMLVPVLREGVA